MSGAGWIRAQGVSTSPIIAYRIRPLTNHRIDTVGVHYSGTLWRWYRNWVGNVEAIKAKYGPRWYRVRLIRNPVYANSYLICNRFGSFSWAGPSLPLARVWPPATRWLLSRTSTRPTVSTESPPSMVWLVPSRLAARPASPDCLKQFILAI